MFSASCCFCFFVLLSLSMSLVSSMDHIACNKTDDDDDYYYYYYYLKLKALFIVVEI